MAAKSIAQRQFMAICEHDPQHAKGKCPDMTKEQLHEYASTPEKGLPKKVSQKKKSTHRKTSLKRLFGR